MKILTNIFILFILLGLSSCYSDVNVNDYVDVKATSLFVKSLLLEGENPVVAVSTAVSAYGVDDAEVLTSQDVSVDLVLGDSKISLDYDTLNKIFTSKEYEILSKANYSLDVVSNDESKFSSARALTTVPVILDPFTFKMLDNQSFSPVAGVRQYVYTIRITFPERKGEYYLIQPLSREITQDPNAPISTRTWTSNFFDYDVIALDRKDNLVKILNDDKSVVVDQSNGEVKSIEVTIALDRTLDPEFVQEHIYFKVYNTTKDYYRYLRSAGNPIEMSQTSFAEPIVEFNNIDNGKGILGGAAMRLDSLVIN